MVAPNSVLFRRSTFFVDVMNVVLYTDLFIYRDMRERIKKNECLKYFFEEGFPDYQASELSDPEIVKLVAKKSNLNILEDWFNQIRFEELNPNKDATQFLKTLYYQIFTEPIYEGFVQVTEFGHALKMLVGDAQLDRITFYIPFESGVIIEALMEEFKGPHIGKLSIMTGDKIYHKQEFDNADSYVFEASYDIDHYLRVKHKRPIEVLIPAYEFNLASDRGSYERLFEDATNRRVRLMEPAPDYIEKYNIFINSINVPI